MEKGGKWVAMGEKRWRDDGVGWNEEGGVRKDDKKIERWKEAVW